MWCLSTVSPDLGGMDPCSVSRRSRSHGIMWTTTLAWSACRSESTSLGSLIFRNYQWGAEKRNSILWFDDNFVGTELDPNLSFAKVAEGCGLKGLQVKTQDELTNALKKSCEEQKKGITTFIEVILNQELGEPFRRDAMKKPVKVSGINKKDMRPQKGAN